MMKLLEENIFKCSEEERIIFNLLFKAAGKERIKWIRIEATWVSFFSKIERS